MLTAHLERAPESHSACSHMMASAQVPVLLTVHHSSVEVLAPPTCEVEPWGKCTEGQICCPLSKPNHAQNGPFKCSYKNGYYSQCVPA